MRKIVSLSRIHTGVAVCLMLLIFVCFSLLFYILLTFAFANAESLIIGFKMLTIYFIASFSHE